MNDLERMKLENQVDKNENVTVEEISDFKRLVVQQVQEFCSRVWAIQQALEEKECFNEISTTFDILYGKKIEFSIKCVDQEPKTKLIL